MPTAPSPQSAEASRHVLIVEDDESSARALSLLVRGTSRTATIAPTIADAVAFLDQQTPETVILDLMLPDGDGATVLERIRRQGLRVKVLVTTASSDRRRLQHVRDLGADVVMHKPIDVAELLRRL
jgi:DNA-binding response OmpR family regulator